MKWEILKGSEKDFDGAPKFATVKLAHATGGTVFAEGAYFGARRTGFYGLTDMNIVALHEYNVIAERRPITEPVANQQLTPEWSGDGLPPVGSVVEMNSEQYADYEWVRAKVVFEHNGEIIVVVNMPGEPVDQQMSKHSAGFDGAKFRPIRSPEEVARDEAISEMLMVEGGMPDSYQPYEIVAALYDAGYRKVE